MTSFVIYDETGRVNAVHPVQPESGAFIAADVAIIPNRHYVQGGKLCLAVEPPSPNHAFDYATKQWFDPRTLDELKAEKWEAIKSIREAALLAPLTTPLGVFDADAKSQKSITDAVLMLQTLTSVGQSPTVDFTLADNTVVTLGTEDMVMVGLALGQRTQQILAIARALRAAKDAATTPEELAAVVWPP